MPPDPTQDSMSAAPLVPRSISTRSLQSQRDCVLQPKVARHQLPWVGAGKAPTPTGLRPARLAAPILPFGSRLESL